MNAVMGRISGLKIRLWAIFRLVGHLPLKPQYYVKVYTAAGQAGGCLHTTVVLQAYQADLLKEMDEGDEIKNEGIFELHRATDLSLRATKETARPIGRSKAALVATQRHLWLTLSQIREKDRVSLLDAPILPSGLFSDALNSSLTGFRRLRNKRRRFKNFSLVVLRMGLIGGISPSRVRAPLTEKSRNRALPLVSLLK